MYKVSSPSLVRPLLDLLLAETKPITPEQFSFVIKQFSLENVPNKFWLEEEMQEHVERWHQFGWRELADTELRQIQASYDKRFFPNGSLALPIPSVSWRLDFLSQLTREEQEKAEIAITMHALASFRQCMLARDELLVLDWQHTCYRLNVHRGIHKAYRDEWAKPILSAHDDLAYLAPDFHFGLMSMRDGSFHVFGDVFHKVFLRGLPEVAFCNTAFLRDGAN